MRPVILPPAARQCRPLLAFAQVTAALLVLTLAVLLSPARATAKAAPGVLDFALAQSLPPCARKGAACDL